MGTLYAFIFGLVVGICGTLVVVAILNQYETEKRFKEHRDEMNDKYEENER